MSEERDADAGDGREVIRTLAERAAQLQARAAQVAIDAAGLRANAAQVARDAAAARQGVVASIHEAGEASPAAAGETAGAAQDADLPRPDE